MSEALAVEDVVAKDEADVVIPNEVGTDKEGLRQAVGGGLLSVLKVDAPGGAVAEEAAEGGEVVRGGDDEDLADASQHEYGDGVVNHGLVVHGDHLLGDAFGDGVEACARSAREYDSFHKLDFILSAYGPISSVLLFI